MWLDIVRAMVFVLELNIEKEYAISFACQRIDFTAEKRSLVLMAISPSSYSPHNNKTQSNLNRYTLKDPNRD